MPDIINVKTDIEYQAAAGLFRQYATWLNIDLGFQHFEEELSQLKTMYGPPAAGIILVKEEGEYIGCVAIRKSGTEVAELKRIYVKPAFQKKGIGNMLLQEALVRAKEWGYKKIRLDTLSNMTPAIALYKNNGFYEIEAYYHNPEPTAVYFEKLLQ